MEINEAVTRAHGNSIAKGWYEGAPRTPLEIHMLIVSEVAEATEAVRSKLPPVYFETRRDGARYDMSVSDFMEMLPGIPDPRDVPKPEGEAIELVDAVIRIMDYFGAKRWDLESLLKVKMAYNETRPHRHGGKAL